MDGDADQPDPVLTEQLEECEACREYFDLRVASGDEWSRIGQFLQPGKHDRATRIGFSAGSNAGQQARQSVSINEVLESLAPTDDPHSLGRVGKYEIKGVIGAGGMGVVLKAFEPSLDRVVAIKVLAPHLANNDKARRRFEREARAAAAVINPNVIPIYSVTNDGKLPYLVMACIQGGSLQRRLDNQGAASVREVLRIGSQIASGLAAAHEQGLVHRDIKPENILFEGDVERIAITDFGLARAVDDNTLTQAGTIAGTPMYMSPEQARGEQVDPQSDLFSLGSVLYALCTGQPPYRADSSLGVMRKITDDAPVPVRELNPEMPQWLSDTIRKLMAKDKGDRFASASEVHDLLESCLSHVQAPETVPLPAQVLSSSRNDKPPIKRWTAVGFGGMLTALIAAAVFFIVTNNGIVKVKVLDESLKVVIDDKPELTITESGNSQPITLRAGDHQLVVSIGDTELLTNNFKIRRNGRTAIEVELLGGEVVLKEDGTVIGAEKLFGSVPSQSASISSSIVESSLRAAIKKPDGELNSRDLQKEIWRLDFRFAAVTDEDLKDVPKLAHVKEILFNHSAKISDSGLKEIAKLRHLEGLSLMETQITDAGLQHLAPLKNINSLNLQKTAITSDGLNKLLKIWNKPVDQDGTGASPLTFLLLDGCANIDDESLTEISRLRSLKILQWGGTNVSSEAVKKLSTLKYLASPNLGNPSVPNSEEKTFADLSDADLALVYKQITGTELAEGVVSGPDLASSLNILLGYDNISREKIAENLVKLGKPEVAKVVLSSGRVDAAATEAFKMGDMLVASGDEAKAVDAYLNALRIAPRLFNEKYIKPFDEQNRLKELAELFTEERIRETKLESVTPMSSLLERLMFFPIA